MVYRQPATGDVIDGNRRKRGTGRVAVDQHNGCAAGLQGEHPAEVFADGGHQKSEHPLLVEGVDVGAFPAGVVVGGSEKHREIELRRPTLRASGDETARKRKAAAALGLISAIDAYGGFLIPQALNLSFQATGAYAGAFTGFVAGYAALLVLTYVVYVRPGHLREHKI